MNSQCHLDEHKYLRHLVAQTTKNVMEIENALNGNDRWWKLRAITIKSHLRASDERIKLSNMLEHRVRFEFIVQRVWWF